MNSESSFTTVSHFMKSSPLVSWAKTFQDEEKKTLEFKGLCDGNFLYNIWLEIDPHPPYHGISVSTSDAASRIRNLDVLIHNIKAFYEEVLGQLLLVKVPDILTLAKHHEEYTSVGEMETLLLLILGCAVQCERKEHFIEIIKSMDLEVQHKIVDYIQQITDNPEAIWTTDWNELSLVPSDDQEHMYNLLIQHLRRLVREKDDLSQKLVASALQNISLSSGNQHAMSPSTISNVDKSHLIVELADVKSRLRKLQQEVEEKNEAITELKEELEISKDAHSKLRQENLELIQDARTAKTYRDEIDILKERVRKVDRLESEIQRYKDKMNELEFYKSRVEELREDNRILVETKTMLEEQLEVSRKRAEQVVDLEAEILKHCAQVNELTIERESDRDKIEQLLEENTQLHLDRKSCMEELLQLQTKLSHTLCHSSPVENHGLMDQLNTDAQTRVFQLELENQRLRILVDSLNRSPSFEVMGTESMQDMQKYMDNLDHSLVIEEGNGNFEYVATMKKENNSLKEKNANIEKELEDLKATLKKLRNFETQHQESEKVVEQLRHSLNSQKADTVKCEQLEHNVSTLNSENQKLQRLVDTGQQRIDELQQDLQSTESENQKLSNNMESMKQSIRKYHDLERETTNLETVNHRLEQEMKGLEKENQRLKNSVESKDATIEGYSSRISYLERENKELMKQAYNFTQLTTKNRDLERENKELCQQAALSKKSLEALRQDLVSEKIANQKLNGEIHKVKLLKESCESVPEAVHHEPENQINELKAADRFLTEEEPKKIDTLNIERNSCQSDCKTHVQTCPSPNLEKTNETLSLNSISKNNATLSELIEELTRLKSDVQDLEKRNIAVEEENANFYNQTLSLKEQNSNLKTQLDTMEQHLASVHFQNNALQSQLAKLEVEITLATSQNTTLVSQNSMLQSQVSNLEEQNKKAHQQYEEAYSKKQRLLNNHESLQKLHEQLTNDYELLLKNHNSLKSLHKNLKTEHNNLKEKLEAAMLSQEEFARIREVLEENNSQPDTRVPSNLRNEQKQLRDQLKSLKDRHETILKEFKSLQITHKSLKSENNDLKLKYTSMQGELLECQSETSTLDVEVAKLTSCCELLSQKNSLLEEEQGSLMSHVSSLLTQYHELLYQVVYEHGKFRQEENSFHERLCDLCQQKEKLEQKILDHCHKLQKSPKRKNNPLGGSLRMRRTRSAFIRNSKHGDGFNFHSDNSTDSSVYCSIRRPKKPSSWTHMNKSHSLNPEDSSQEDHIPVRDVGLGVLQDANTPVAISQKIDKASQDNNRQQMIENNLTLNLVTNLTNVTENSTKLPFYRSISTQQMPFQPIEQTFNPLMTKSVPQGVQNLAKITSDAGRDSSTDLSEVSRNTKTDQSSMQNATKEKNAENSIWYEYGCV